jgi:hypothetical protein
MTVYLYIYDDLKFKEEKVRFPNYDGYYLYRQKCDTN